MSKQAPRFHHQTEHVLHIWCRLMLASTVCWRHNASTAAAHPRTPTTHTHPEQDEVPGGGVRDAGEQQAGACHHQRVERVHLPLVRLPQRPPQAEDDPAGGAQREAVEQRVDVVLLRGCAGGWRRVRAAAAVIATQQHNVVHVTIMSRSSPLTPTRYHVLGRTQRQRRTRHAPPPARHRTTRTHTPS